MRAILVICIAAIIIFMAVSWWNKFPWESETDSCKGSSNLDVYRICVALQECDKEFGENKELVSDCRADVYFNVLAGNDLQ